MAIHPNGTNDIQVNTIAERTAGVGLTIDGLRIKDNGIDAVAATDCPIGINGTVKWRFRSTAFDLVPETDNDVKIGDSIGPKRLSAVHSRNFYGGGGSMQVGTIDAQSLSLIVNSTSVLSVDTSNNITIPDNNGLFKFTNGDGSYLALNVGSASAAGTTATDATDLARTVNIITTVAAATGVQLPAADASSGTLIIVCNRGANALTVYPPTGDTIQGAASVSLPTGDMLFAIKGGSTDWSIGIAPG